MSEKILKRLQKLRQKLAEKELDAIFISQPENRYYLSGFHGSWGFLLITQQKATLAVDFRYVEQGKTQAPDYETLRIGGETSKWFPQLMDGLNIKKLGFEEGDVTFGLYRQLTCAAGALQPSLQLVPLSGLVKGLRAVKEPEEIELITKAAAIADSAIEHITSAIRPGMTEKEAAWEIEKGLREKGSQPIPFDVIFASGPNGALPHATPSERQVKAGEPIVIDIGAKYELYACDMTRTICAGAPDATFKKVYDIVLGAQLAAMAIIKEGMTGEQADNVARTVIKEAGYAEAFGHSLGHGVGLAVHELPRLGPNSSDVLTSSMVFTIEPGIYLPGWGGVRIEDTVVMEGGKVRALSKSPK